MVFVLLLLVAASAHADPFFVDATREAGLDHATVNGGANKHFILESTGSGAAFFDSDRDGDLDLYVVNGSTYAHYAARSGPGNVLYRNEGRGTFAAVVAGVEDRGWGMGVAVGDYDGDGHSDLYVTNYGANALYRNRGDGAFAAVAAPAGVAGDGFSTSAAFFDYDGDGDLDLYVANYVVFDLEPVLQDPELEDPCIYLGGLRVFCGPQGMAGGRDRLYRNDGGTFADATAASGAAAANAYYGLGVVSADFDRDGDLDLFVANDETPNVLFRNDGGRLGDIGLQAGVAYNGDGEAEASMGVDAGDCDGDGDLDLYVTNFYGETNTLYLNSGNGTFIDATSERGLAAPTASYLGWGTRFFDFDFDGDLDLFVANGHIYPQVDRASAGGTYAQRNQLFANEGSGAFSAVEGAGPGLLVQKSSRAAISGDYDQDGDVDLFTTNIDDSPTLLRNETRSGRYLVVQVEPEVVGTWVRLVAGGRTQVRAVGGAASYLGHSDARLHFGLGRAERVERVEVWWPDGAVTRLEDLPVDEVVVVVQGAGD